MPPPSEPGDNSQGSLRTQEFFGDSPGITQPGFRPLVKFSGKMTLHRLLVSEVNEREEST